MLLIHNSLIKKRVFTSEHRFVLWDPWELSFLEEGAHGVWSFPCLASSWLRLSALLGAQETLLISKCDKSGRAALAR